MTAVGLDFDLIPRGDDEPSDRDGDKIYDDEDQCPNDPEDMDGDADGDGCPEDDADSGSRIETEGRGKRESRVNSEGLEGGDYTRALRANRRVEVIAP